MNIHPIFVHFPIALFTIYALLEVFSIIFKRFNLETTKAVIVTIGTVLAFVTLQTGESAQHLITGSDNTLRPLIEKHSAYATLSTYLFLSITLVYIFRYCRDNGIFTKFKLPNLTTEITNLYLKYLDNKYFLVTIAILGLITITITGALGGAIVYGPDVDPAVSFIYHFFF